MEQNYFCRLQGSVHSSIIILCWSCGFSIPNDVSFLFIIICQLPSTFVVYLSGANFVHTFEGLLLCLPTEFGFIGYLMHMQLMWCEMRYVGCVELLITLCCNRVITECLSCFCWCCCCWWWWSWWWKWCRNKHVVNFFTQWAFVISAIWSIFWWFCFSVIPI